MPPGSDEMHDIAIAKAIEHGPRVFNICGTNRLAYGLTKREAKVLFQRCGYNSTTGSRWRGVIGEWIDDDFAYFDRLTITHPELIQDKKEQLDWSIVFCLVSNSQLIDLQREAEDQQIRTWPTREMWDDYAKSDPFTAY